MMPKSHRIPPILQSKCHTDACQRLQHRSHGGRAFSFEVAGDILGDERDAGARGDRGDGADLIGQLFGPRNDIVWYGAAASPRTSVALTGRYSLALGIRGGASELAPRPLRRRGPCSARRGGSLSLRPQGQPPNHNPARPEHRALCDAGGSASPVPCHG